MDPGRGAAPANFMQKGYVFMSTALGAFRKANPHMTIKTLEDPAFAKYGRVHPQIDASAFAEYLNTHADMSKPGEYVPSIPELEQPCALLTQITEQVYGGVTPQVGWCIGHNRSMNGMEYHKGNELMVTGTDLVVLLGQFTDVCFGEKITYDAAKHEAFFIPAGAVVEVYGLVLHFSPCTVHADQGFRTLIILPRDTNTDLDFTPSGSAAEDPILVAKNKWLIMHEDLPRGYRGIYGENYTVNPI